MFMRSFKFPRAVLLEMCAESAHGFMHLAPGLFVPDLKGLSGTGKSELQSCSLSLALQTAAPTQLWYTTRILSGRHDGQSVLVPVTSTWAVDGRILRIIGSFSENAGCLTSFPCVCGLLIICKTVD